MSTVAYNDHSAALTAADSARREATARRQHHHQRHNYPHARARTATALQQSQPRSAPTRAQQILLTAAAAAAEDKRKSAVELLAESKSSYYRCVGRGGAGKQLQGAQHGVAGQTSQRDRDGQYILVSPSRSLPPTSRQSISRRSGSAGSDVLQTKLRRLLNCTAAVANSDSQDCKENVTPQSLSQQFTGYLLHSDNHQTYDARATAAGNAGHFVGFDASSAQQRRHYDRYQYSNYASSSGQERLLTTSCVGAANLANQNSPNNNTINNNDICEGDLNQQHADNNGGRSYMKKELHLPQQSASQQTNCDHFPNTFLSPQSTVQSSILSGSTATTTTTTQDKQRHMLLYSASSGEVMSDRTNCHDCDYEESGGGCAVVCSGKSCDNLVTTFVTDDYRAISPPAEYAVTERSSYRCFRSYSHSQPIQRGGEPCSVRVSSDDRISNSAPPYDTADSHKSLPDLYTQTHITSSSSSYQYYNSYQQQQANDTSQQQRDIYRQQQQQQQSTNHHPPPPAQTHTPPSLQHSNLQQNNHSASSSNCHYDGNSTEALSSCSKGTKSDIFSKSNRSSDIFIKSSRSNSSFNRDSGGSSGHYTHRSEPARNRTAHASNNSCEYRRDSGSSTQHSGNSAGYYDMYNNGSSRSPRFPDIIETQIVENCVECRAMYHHHQHRETFSQQQPQQRYSCECMDDDLLYEDGLTMHFETPAVPVEFQDDYQGPPPQTTTQSVDANSARYRQQHATDDATEYTTTAGIYMDAAKYKISERGYTKDCNYRVRSDVYCKTADFGYKDSGASSLPPCTRTEQELSPPLGTFKRQKCFRYKNRGQNCSRYDFDDIQTAATTSTSRPVLRSKSDISDRYYRVEKTRGGVHSTMGGVNKRMSTMSMVTCGGGGGVVNAATSGNVGIISDDRPDDTDDDEAMMRLERFFDRLGLSDETYDGIMLQQRSTPPRSSQKHQQLSEFNTIDCGSTSTQQLQQLQLQCCDSPVFFSDVSTVDSNRPTSYLHTQQQLQQQHGGGGLLPGESLCTDYTNSPSNNALGGGQQQQTSTGGGGPGFRANEPPSIVERNARIIKWLCNCRKSQQLQQNATNNSGAVAVVTGGAITGQQQQQQLLQQKVADR